MNYSADKLLTQFEWFWAVEFEWFWAYVLRLWFQFLYKNLFETILFFSLFGDVINNYQSRSDFDLVKAKIGLSWAKILEVFNLCHQFQFSIKIKEPQKKYTNKIMLNLGVW